MRAFLDRESSLLAIVLALMMFILVSETLVAFVMLASGTAVLNSLVMIAINVWFLVLIPYKYLTDWAEKVDRV